MELFYDTPYNNLFQMLFFNDLSASKETFFILLIFEHSLQRFQNFLSLIF